MFILKVVIYCVTIAAALFFGSRQSRLERQLTDDAPRLPENVVDRGILDDFKERMGRWQYLQSLPKQALVEYKRAVMLKFIFMAILFAEVIILQR
jgi:hypothetical protein